MKITKFEDLNAWKSAQTLAVNIYKVSISIEDYAFKNQINRAAVSVSNNIAEGFNRASNAEFRRFLYYAKGSCSEVKSMLYLAERLTFISTQEKDSLIGSCSEVFKIIKGLIRHLDSKL